MSKRQIASHYQDPVDLIWLRAAADLGLKIVRSSEAFASYDGKGNLTIAQPTDFDPDDCLAQMIFHEICHWLVAGRRGIQLPDWGLSNFDDRDLVQEQASHRVQAALADRYGLRDFMAVTTDWRTYWDALPADPLRDGDDPAIPLAQDAEILSRSEPFVSVLSRSLSATAAIANAVREIASPDSLWSQSRPLHRLGSLLSNDPTRKCGQCGWAFEQLDPSGCPQLACRQHKPLGEETAPTVDSDETACQRREPKFSIDDCGSCGACCRQGFDVLALEASDPFRQLHPELVQVKDGEYRVPRPEGRCVALEGDGDASSPYRCIHYAIRPKNCADFEVAGDACLLARRRVGLSR